MFERDIERISQEIEELGDSPFGYQPSYALKRRLGSADTPQKTKFSELREVTLNRLSWEYRKFLEKYTTSEVENVSHTGLDLDKIEDLLRDISKSDDTQRIISLSSFLHSMELVAKRDLAFAAEIPTEDIARRAAIEYLVDKKLDQRVRVWTQLHQHLKAKM